MSKDIVYKKPKPENRRLVGKQVKSSGPRDRQRKQENKQMDEKIDAALKSTKRKIKSTSSKQVKELEAQLEAAKIKIKLMDELVIEKDREITELRIQVNEKDKHINTMSDIKSQLNGLATKIASGAVISDDTSRPIMDTRVFIDPLEEDRELDAHIKIKSDSDKDKNILSDVSKLKKLLGDK